MLHGRQTLSEPRKGSSVKGQKFGQQQQASLVLLGQASLKRPDPMGREEVVSKLAREVQVVKICGCGFRCVIRA